MVKSNDHAQHIEPLRWPGPAIRVTLRWDGTDWRIQREHRVDSMTLPAPDPLPAGENSRGFWVETIDRQGRVLHREVMPDPLAGMEQFDPDGLVTRLPHPPHDVAIEVIVPDLPDLAKLILVSNPVPAPGGHDHAPRPRRSEVSITGRPRQDDSGDPTKHDHPPHEHEAPHGHDAPPARDRNKPRRRS